MASKKKSAKKVVVKKSAKKAVSKKPKAGASKWLLEPPGVGEVSVQVAVGKKVKLTPKIRKALEELAASLQPAARTAMLAVGKKECLPDYACTTHTTGCTDNGSCVTQFQQPCLVQYGCKVKVPLQDTGAS